MTKPAIDEPAKDHRTRKNLIETVAYLRKQKDELLEQTASLEGRCKAQAADNLALEKKIESSRKDFADLKARLLAAELVNAEMRGYIARLQEDDVVREELVTTGEPDGQQRMVPKRKHRTFDTPNQFTIDRQEGMGLSDRMYREHRGQNHKPRCWVEY